MAVDVVMPQMGESIFEGTVTKWLRQPGDQVRRDEPLFEISTDKVDAEIPSPASGVLKEIKVAAGKTVQVNTVVAILEEAGAAAAPSAPAPAAQPPAAAAAAPPAAAPAAAPPAAPVADARSSQEVRSSPLVRRLARENNVALATVPGSGSGGRVSKRDLMNYLEAAPAEVPAAALAAVAPPVYAPGSVEIVPMTNMRKRIAEHMVMSKRTSPHVYSVFAVDVTNIAKLRDRSKKQFEAATGQKLTFMPFFCQAMVETLRKFRVLNSSVQEDSVVYKNDINLGIAVSLDWGLIVPVIKHAEEKNFLGLQRAINDLADRARNKKLSPDEVQDGTFSISNYGIYGGMIGMPVINQPQVAILGIGGIRKTPVVIDDAIAIRSIVHLTLSFDHRVVDGATADQSLAFLRDRLEGWSEPIV